MLSTAESGVRHRWALTSPGYPPTPLETSYNVKQVLELNPGPCTFYHAPISLTLGLLGLQGLLMSPCSPQAHNPPASPTRGLWLSSPHHHVWLSKVSKGRGLPLKVIDFPAHFPLSLLYFTSPKPCVFQSLDR